MIIPLRSSAVNPQNEIQATYDDICQVLATVGKQQTPLQFLQDLYQNDGEQDVKPFKKGGNSLDNQPKHFRLAYTLQKARKKKADARGNWFGTVGKADKFQELVDIARFHDDMYIPPSIYINGFASKSTLWWHMGLVVDIDNLKDTASLTTDDVKILLTHIQLGTIAKPTTIVASGGGLHFYYMLSEPWAGYANRYEIMLEWKRLLVKKIAGLGVGKVDGLSVTQGHRIPGSNTKRGVKVISFKTGERYTVDALADLCGGKRAPTQEDWSSLKDKNKTKTATKPAKTTTAIKTTEKPDNVVEFVKPNGKIQFWRWLQKYVLTHRPQPRGRYNALMAMAIVAKKCNVPYEEAEDFISMVRRVLNHDTPHDIVGDEEMPKIMGAYALNRVKTNSKTLEALLGFDFPRTTKRNFRPQDVHLARVHSARKGESAFKIKKWREQNPEGTQKACVEQLKVGSATVCKYWRI